MARAGKAASAGAALRLATLRQEQDDVGIAAIRRELRAWLKGSKAGKAVERAVKRLLVQEGSL